MIARETLILEDHPIISILHMTKATGLGDNQTFPVQHLKEAEVGDIGRSHGNHMLTHIRDGKMYPMHCCIH